MAENKKFDLELLTLQRSFVGGIPDRLEAIQEMLLLLEKFPTTNEAPETLRGLMSEVHSLKGSASAHDLYCISRLCHKMEDLLVGISKQQIKISSSSVSVLLNFVDLISKYCEEFLESNVPPDINEYEIQIKQIDLIKQLTENSRSGLYKLTKSLSHLNRIFVLDDDQDMLAIYRLALQKNLEQTTMFFHDSTQAIQQIIYFKPDLLICDLHMPEKNGLDILKEIHLSHLSGLPVLFVTGDIDSDLAKSALQSGALAVLDKNLINPHFSQWLQNYLRHLETKQMSLNKTAV